MTRPTSREVMDLLAASAAEFLAGPANDLSHPDGPEPAFGPPLFGCASGADPLWLEFKTAVGPEQFTPREVFRLAYPDDPAEPGELAVVCFVLPQTEATRREQRREREFPGQRWVRSRYLGQVRTIDGLTRRLTEVLLEAGLRAVAPDQRPEFDGNLTGGPYLFFSNWSHRHAALAAGLGTFGPCDGLITELGKAVRFGSLVVKSPIPPTPRPYSGYRDYCLWYNSGTCGKCIGRCPAGAVSPEGHDKKLCAAYVLGDSKKYISRTWPELDGAYGCGLCQTGVPCESRIPPRPAGQNGG